LRRALEVTQTAAPEGAQPPFVFVNAWNEWAEAAYLEPDRRFGYAYLRATANVMRDYIVPHPEFVSVVEQSQRNFVKRSDVGIMVHLHDDELLEDAARYIANCESADIFVSLRRDTSPAVADRFLARFPRARLAYFGNRGRDIWPFIAQLPLLLCQNYNYACKIHCQRYATRADGDALRTGVLNALLGSPETVTRILSRFAAQPALGLLAPACALLELQNPDCTARNGKWLDFLCRKLGMDQPEKHGAKLSEGSMCWLRPQAFGALTGLDLKAEQFEDELGQRDGTLAHAVERLLAAIASQNGYTVEET